MTPHPKSLLTKPMPAQEDPIRVHDRSLALANRLVSSRLLAAGLWFVAIAVVLWGLEYRLSLYQPHPGAAARASVAKLWIGPRSMVALRPVALSANHDLPIYLAEGLQRCRASNHAFRLFVSPVNSVDTPIVLASPRSPPLA